ncbi:MAG: hypothetical protein V4692_14235 [Bdellovibrionota bacterium]
MIPTLIGQFVLVGAIVGFGAPALAELDAGSSEALVETQTLLTSPEALKAETAKNPKAKQVDDNVKFLMGNEAQAAEVYKLAAEIFGTMVQKSNGDPEQLQKLIMEAQKNPAAFGQSFTPEQKAQIKSLGAKAEGRKPTSGAPGQR